MRPIFETRSTDGGWLGTFVLPLQIDEQKGDQYY